MTYIVDKHTRSRMMDGIGSKNRKPEMVLRRGPCTHVASAQGYRVWTSRMLNQEHIVNETIALVAFGGCESRSKTSLRPVRSTTLVFPRERGTRLALIEIAQLDGKIARSEPYGHQ